MASGMKVFQELFQYLILMRKGQYLPEYLDIIMYNGEYKEQIMRYIFYKLYKLLKNICIQIID